MTVLSTSAPGSSRRGREVYFAALADPDSLADVVPYGDCCFEQLSYVGDYAYEQAHWKKRL